MSGAEVQSVMSNSIPPLPPAAPPAILSQSPGSTNAMGDYVTFSAQVLGDPPLSFQWLQNGVPMPGQTNASVFPPTYASGSNWFALHVSNSGGAITGAPISLVVLPDPAPNVGAGLVSWWPFDTFLNASGTISTPDLYSGNDLTLKAIGSTNLVTGKFGNALALDGLQQYGLRTGGFPIYLATNYTVSLWVKGSAGQTNKQVFAEGGAGGNFFLLGTENSNPYGGLLNIKVNPGMSDRKSTRVVFDGSWHHVVWVDGNGKARLFVDKALDETDYAYPRVNPFLETTAIGALVRAYAANFFAGAVDDLAVWDRVLTYSEILLVASNSIPPAAGPIPPAIFTQPTDRTNGIYAGDSISFSVVATGSSPFHYQWRKDGLDVTTQSNPSAVSNVLTFASVQAGDAGAYCLVITNAVGAVTSSVVQLAVIAYTPVTNGVALQLDVDLTGAPNTQPGFQAFTLGSNGAVFSNAATVVLAPIGSASLAERQRSASPLVIDNLPALTQARLYDDFTFASSTADGTGLSILISHLAPSTLYGLTIWSFDPQSPGARTSDWTETASGASVPIVTGYTFNGSSLPIADYDDTFGALLTSSPAGQLQIQAVRHGGTSYGVFLNALQLVANPSIRITRARLAGDGNLELVVQTQYPGQSISFEESADLSSGSWRPTAGGVIILVHGPLVITEFPVPAGPFFYRVATQ